MTTDKTLMIRISEDAKEYLQQLAKERGQSMTRVIQQLLEEHRDRRFFEGLDADYKALRNDKESWDQEKKEQALWDTALADGLDE